MSQEDVVHAYRKRAGRYDRAVTFFDLFRPFGFDIPAWRREAVRALDLKPGDTVVEIGCGTGLNFPLLQEAVTPEGKIIGVELSEAMLSQARQRVADNGWKNVELVHTDAAWFEFPANVGGILSTFVLILIPECGQIVSRGCEALAPGRRWAVLDMAWPRSFPLWWRHMLFFLKSYGVTEETLKRRPWDIVWETLQQQLVDVTRRSYWMGFFYLATGRRETG